MDIVFLNDTFLLCDQILELVPTSAMMLAPSTDNSDSIENFRGSALFVSFEILCQLLDCLLKTHISSSSVDSNDYFDSQNGHPFSVTISNMVKLILKLEVNEFFIDILANLEEFEYLRFCSTINSILKCASEVSMVNSWL